MSTIAAYPARVPIDLDEYAPRRRDTPARYGLPQEVRFCRSCVISNQRPNSAVEYEHMRDSAKATINFDAEGVCDACRVAELKREIDWSERRRELEELCDRFRRADGSYDCIVPGSGGKDSFYAAWMLTSEDRSRVYAVAVEELAPVLPRHRAYLLGDDGAALLNGTVAARVAVHEADLGHRAGEPSEPRLRRAMAGARALLRRHGSWASHPVAASTVCPCPRGHPRRAYRRSPACTCPTTGPSRPRRCEEPSHPHAARRTT